MNLIQTTVAVQQPSPTELEWTSNSASNSDTGQLKNRERKTQVLQFALVHWTVFWQLARLSHSTPLGVNESISSAVESAGLQSRSTTRVHQTWKPPQGPTVSSRF